MCIDTMIAMEAVAEAKDVLISPEGCRRGRSVPVLAGRGGDRDDTAVEGLAELTLGYTRKSLRALARRREQDRGVGTAPCRVGKKETKCARLVQRSAFHHQASTGHPFSSGWPLGRKRQGGFRFGCFTHDKGRQKEQQRRLCTSRSALPNGGGRTKNVGGLPDGAFL